MKAYTVVGLYLSGNEGSFVDHTMADNPANAELNVAKERTDEADEVRIVAVFDGHLIDVCEFVHTPED